MIRVTADSTCDLPKEILAQYNIAITPLGVVKGEGLFHDNVDITTADIVSHVAAGGDITTTNAVNIIDYYEFFKAEKEGYDGLIHINLGAGFSSCHQNACMVASEMEDVVAVDSCNLSIGHGALVLAVAKAAWAGASLEDLVALAEDLRPKIETSFVLDTLDFMKKGGRCSAVTAIGANLLKLHPCIEVNDGKMVVTKKYRGALDKVMPQYVADRLSGRTDLDTQVIYMADSCNNPDHPMIGAARTAIDGLSQFDQVEHYDIGCTIFCHCGPNTLGLVVVRK